MGSGCLQNANKLPELLKDKLNGKRKWEDICRDWYMNESGTGD